MNSAGGDVTAINADGAVAGSVTLDGQPEAAVVDHKEDNKEKVFVNISARIRLLSFDAQTLKIIHRWPLAPGEGPSGLGIDQ